MKKGKNLLENDWDLKNFPLANISNDIHNVFQRVFRINNYYLCKSDKNIGLIGNGMMNDPYDISYVN